MTKSYGLLCGVGIQYTKLGEVYQYAYNRECGWRYQGRLEKDGWASAQSPLLRAASCGLCVHGLY
jgi:hypothetical protein